MQSLWSADMFWRLFEATGSIWAYLAYRRGAFWPFAVPLSLN